MTKRRLTGEVGPVILESSQYKCSHLRNPHFCPGSEHVNRVKGVKPYICSFLFIHSCLFSLEDLCSKCSGFPGATSARSARWSGSSPRAIWPPTPLCPCRCQFSLFKLVDCDRFSVRLCFMPRQMRSEFGGAIYHVMNRGDRRTVGNGQLDLCLGPARGQTKKGAGV